MAALKVFLCVVRYAVIAYLWHGVSVQSCQWSGFGGCECNILGACDLAGNPRSGSDNKLTGYAPSGLEQFGFAVNYQQNLAYLCEGNTVTVLYDCNARIPLYAATMMTGAQLAASYSRPSTSFKKSHDKKLLKTFQQGHNDYKRSTSRNSCYESRHAMFGTNYFVDPWWYNAASGNTTASFLPCNSTFHLTKTPIHRGHLIAAQYGRGNSTRIKATFRYTNVVPQFGIFNSGQWNVYERKLVEWGQNKCARNNGNLTKNARMYIVVGAIPSTFGSFQHRFFGKSGFSDYQGWSTRANTYAVRSGKEEYRVNVPRYLWAAACCTFQFQNGQGQWQDGTLSTAFYRQNTPGREPCHVTTTVKVMSSLLANYDIFPATSSC